MTEKDIIKRIAKKLEQEEIDQLASYLRKDLDNKPRRRRGMTKCTYEWLGIKLDIDGTKILFIETDNDKGIIYVHHTDEKEGCFDTAEGGSVSSIIDYQNKKECKND